MYRQITMYQIICDECGKVFGRTDNNHALFRNKTADIEGVSKWKVIDGKHYCPVCYWVKRLIGSIPLKKK